MRGVQDTGPEGIANIAETVFQRRDEHLHQLLFARSATDDTGDALCDRRDAGPRGLFDDFGSHQRFDPARACLSGADEDADRAGVRAADRRAFDRGRVQRQANVPEMADEAVTRAA